MKYIKSYILFENNFSKDEKIKYIEGFFNAYSIDNNIDLHKTKVTTTISPVILDSLYFNNNEIYLIYKIDVIDRWPIRGLNIEIIDGIIKYINENYPDYAEGDSMGFFDLKKE